MRSVRELTVTATRIAGGDLTAKARVTSRDEIGILAAEFNRMAERIQQLRLSFAKTSFAFSFNNLGKPDITCELELYETDVRHMALG